MWKLPDDLCEPKELMETMLGLCLVGGLGVAWLFIISLLPD